MKKKTRLPLDADDRRTFERRRRQSADEDARLFLRCFKPHYRAEPKAIQALVTLLMQYYAHGSVDALWHWLDGGGEAKRQRLNDGRRKDFENG